jgi:hypothetical protein
MDYSILLFLDYLLDCENDFGASSCTRSRFFFGQGSNFSLVLKPSTRVDSLFNFFSTLLIVAQSRQWAKELGTVKSQPFLFISVS